MERGIRYLYYPDHLGDISDLEVLYVVHSIELKIINDK